MSFPLITRYGPSPLLDDELATKKYVDDNSASVGDLEFLRDKQLAGDLIIVVGDADGDAAAFTMASTTPAAGKTFFVSNVDIAFNNRDGSAQRMDVQAQNDGTATVTIKADVAASTGSFIPTIKMRGDSMVGDGAVIYRVQKVTGVANANATCVLEGWIQDT